MVLNILGNMLHKKSLGYRKLSCQAKQFAETLDAMR